MSSGVSAGLKWSTISVIGREATRTIFTILLARIVGPDDFGVVAQALVFIGLISLLVDQGFSSALIQREKVEESLPGAVVTVNLLVGLALTLLTIGIAPLWAAFMKTPELTLLLVVFAPTMIIRAASVTPAAMLIRRMDFRTIAIFNVVGAFVGGALGLVAALAGTGYWALLVQIIGTDIIVLLVLLLMGAGIRPNLQLRQLRSIVGFSARAFLAGVLFNSVSRNIDNLLVGRFQGPQALAFYGMAYRLLLMPVQLALSTVSTVLFPAFARMATDVRALGAEVARTTRVVATVALPGMALVAAAAPQLVLVLFGDAWAPAIPIVQVLAVAGALQAVYQSTTTPLVLGTGRDKLNLRFAWLTTIVTTIGIVAGLPFGPLGVAIGYTAATVALVPVEWALRHHIVQTRLADQITPLLPALHVAAWMAGVYLAIAIAVPRHEVVVLIVGLVAALGAGFIVLRFVHRRLLAEIISMGKSLAGRSASPAGETTDALPDDGDAGDSEPPSDQRVREEGAL